MSTARDRVQEMLTNGKPIDQIVAESQWSRRAVQALASTLGMLIHPDTGVAYDPRLPEERVAATYTPPRPERRRAVLAEVQAAEHGTRCVHDRLVAYGLEHSRIGIQRTAERIQRDLAMVAAAAHGDRARAEAYEQRAAGRRAAAMATPDMPSSTRLMLRAHALAEARGIGLPDVRSWCIVRGLCGHRGVLSEDALDQYEDAHPIKEPG